MTSYSAFISLYPSLLSSYVLLFTYYLLLTSYIFLRATYYLLLFVLFRKNDFVAFHFPYCLNKSAGTKNRKITRKTRSNGALFLWEQTFFFPDHNKCLFFKQKVYLVFQQGRLPMPVLKAINITPIKNWSVVVGGREAIKCVSYSIRPSSRENCLSIWPEGKILRTFKKLSQIRIFREIAPILRKNTREDLNTIVSLSIFPQKHKIPGLSLYPGKLRIAQMYQISSFRGCKWDSINEASDSG